MKAHVYKSARRADTYVYLRERDAHGLLPAALADRLGALEFVLEVDLVPGRKLARADADAVRESLAAHGYHVQLPPTPEQLAAAAGNSLLPIDPAGAAAGGRSDAAPGRGARD